MSAEVEGHFLAFGTCFLVFPVLAAPGCHTARTESHYHACGMGPIPCGPIPTCGHWIRAAGNTWFLYEDHDGNVGNQCECHVKREQSTPDFICETSDMLFNGETAQGNGGETSH